MCNHFDVLVIDDEEVVVAAARKVMESEGLTVDQAVDAESATSKIEVNRYSVVLCDLVLPRVSGLEIVARIAACLPGTPVVLITGYATLEHAIAAFRGGAFDFIPKPFDEQELLGVIHRGLQFARAGPTARRPVDQQLLSRTTGSGISSNADLYALGGHAWTAVERDGSAVFGLGETFAVLNEKTVESEPPETGEDILQGNGWLRIIEDTGVVHRAWAPLSGRVIENNEQAFVDIGRVPWVSICTKWLVRVIPSSLKNELPALVRR